MSAEITIHISLETMAGLEQIMKEGDSYDSAIEQLLALKVCVEDMREIVGDDGMTFSVLHTLYRMDPRNRP